MKRDRELIQRLQIEKEMQKLVKRNVRIDNPRFVRECLEEVSIFHLEGFGIQWMETSMRYYKHELPFEDLWSVYQSDREFKNFLFDYLAEIEVQLRNVIGQTLCMQYGEMGYLDSENFKNREFHKNFIDDVNNEIRRANEPFVHFYTKRYEHVPVYIAIEAVTIGTLSKLYSNMKRQDQKIISKYFGIKSERVLISYLYTLTKIRNTCAHHGRLYNRRFSTACAVAHHDEQILKKINPEYRINPYRVFSAILAMMHLLSKESAYEVIEHTENMFKKNKNYELRYLGYPYQWKEFLENVVEAVAAQAE